MSRLEKIKRVTNLKRATIKLAYMREFKLNGNNEVYTALKEAIYREAKTLKLTHKIKEII